MKRTKKIVRIFLVLCLALSSLTIGFTAFAAEDK